MDLTSFSSELADVALYLLQLASLSGIDLEAAIMKKLETNYKREWDEDDLEKGLLGYRESQG